VASGKELSDEDIISPPPSLRYLIVGLGDNTKTRSDFLGRSGTGRDEALLIARPEGDCLAAGTALYAAVPLLERGPIPQPSAIVAQTSTSPKEGDQQ